MASDIPPDRGGGRKPAPRRRAGGSRGRGGEKTEGSARSGESRFFAGATSGLPRLPLEPNARRCQGRDERCGPHAGLNAGCVSFRQGQAIVTGIGGDGRRLAPCSHRARSTGTGDGPWHKRRRSSTRKNRPLSTRLRKTLRRNWGARVSSACSARLTARCGRGRAVPRRCGWIMASTTGRQSVRKEKGQAVEGNGSAYSVLLTRAPGTARNGLKAAATLARKPLLKLPSSSAFGS